MSLKLYVKIKGRYIPVSAVLANQNLKALKKCSIEKAILKYLDVCTSQKCIKNIKNESSYFNKLKSYFDEIEIEYMDEITSEHIDKIESNYLKKMKASSLNRRFSVYRHFFKKCIEWQIILKSPMQDRKVKKHEKNHFRPWTDKEFQAFVELCGAEYAAYFTFLLHTGCRPVEAQGLVWTNIDYDNKKIKFKSYKNAKVSRDFPLTKAADKILHSIKTKAIHVFVDMNGQPIDTDRSYQYAKHRLKQLGFTHLTIYGLRHTFCYKLTSAGLNAFQIQHLMGHAEIETTLNYVHIDEADLVIKVDAVRF